jgi:hypothetical protein
VITGATRAELVLEKVRIADSAAYFVTVQNTSGKAISGKSILSVR